uniref:AlNc14C626G12281 protein n=1 Tax=Albugo laibachii Nc14 TaxID=890382 RepID=F0X1I9_9STRA|nr:AlNc14C626G12281 [Albugo laibachii Nc14]|eukprot:CCA27676.1 AlNc14C626G12281 [Albugo laibachii Nc14]
MLWIRRAHIPETPAPIVTKHPPPQAPVVTKKLSLGGTQGRQAHSMHINFFNTLSTCLQARASTTNLDYVQHMLDQQVIEGSRKS